MPRSVCIDLEQSAVNDILKGPQKGLYTPDQFVTSKEGPANIYPGGRYLLGPSYLDLALERIKKTAEKLESVDGIIIYDSIGGGTGSGLGSLLLEHLESDYEKVKRLGITVFPTPKFSYNVNDTYNSVLACKNLVAHSDFNLIIDNQAVFDICKKRGINASK